MKIDEFFSKTYCINLLKRKDRWNEFVNEMDKYSITNYERYEAVNGDLIRNKTKLLNGELGVLQTHYNIIKHCKKNNINSVLIMEDDVVFNEEINNISEYMKLIPENWDFIYFGGNHIYGKPPVKINEKIIKLNYTVALQCVAIKNTMYDFILQMLEKKEKQVDAYYAELHKFANAYGVYPNIATQREGFSDIQKRNVNYNIFFN
jgi:glycosyl transferase family 25